MIGLKFTSQFGLQRKPSRNTSRGGMLSGAAWFFIEKSAGRKPMANFRRHAAQGMKMMRHCNFICAGWSRFFFSLSNRLWNKSERFEKDGISGSDPEFDCATAANAGSRSTLRRADRSVDGASAG